MIKLLVPCLIMLVLVNCAHKEITQEPIKKPEYQNTFWIGCMNAYLHFEHYKSGHVSEANEWCTRKYNEIKDM